MAYRRFYSYLYSWISRIAFRHQSSVHLKPLPAVRQSKKNIPSDFPHLLSNPSGIPVNLQIIPHSNQGQGLYLLVLARLNARQEHENTHIKPKISPVCLGMSRSGSSKHRLFPISAPHLVIFPYLLPLYRPMIRPDSVAVCATADHWGITVKSLSLSLSLRTLSDGKHCCTYLSCHWLSSQFPAFVLPQHSSWFIPIVHFRPSTQYCRHPL